MEPRHEFREDGVHPVDGPHALDRIWAHSEALRRIAFKDAETGKRLVFLTNHMTLPAATICALYNQRWRVELIFKWIKQHLRIKRFVGTTENAVKTQIGCAVATYVLIASVKKELRLDRSLYQLL